MLADSIPGKLYRYWCHSAVFFLLQRIYRWFHNAWMCSLIRRMFIRESCIQRAYESSLFSQVIRAILSGITWLFAHISVKIGRVNSGSLNYRFWQRFGSGSVILKYDFLFGVFLAFMFLCPHTLWSNTYALLASVAFLLLYLAVCAQRGCRPLDPSKLGLPFLLFICATALSMAFSKAPEDSFRVLLFFLTAFLLCYLVAGAIRNRRSLMTILGMLYVAVLLTACYAIVQRILGVEVSSSFTDLDINKGVPGRVYSTLDNPNNYAEFLVLMTPLAAAWAINVKTRWRNIPLYFPFCIGILLPMLAIVMTYSRNGWIAIALAVLVFVYFAEKKLIPMLFLIAVIAIPFLPASVITRISTLFNSKDSSTNHRIHLWRGILLMLKDYGITGIGLGPESFEKIYPLYARRLAMTGAFHTQMVYLELIVETGLLGFFSFLWFFFQTIKNVTCKLASSKVLSRRIALSACAAALVGIAFSFCVEYVWYYPRILFAFFLVCGIAIGLTHAEDGVFQLHSEKD